MSVYVSVSVSCVWLRSLEDTLFSACPVLLTQVACRCAAITGGAEACRLEGGVLRQVPAGVRKQGWGRCQRVGQQGKGSGRADEPRWVKRCECVSKRTWMGSVLGAMRLLRLFFVTSPLIARNGRVCVYFLSQLWCARSRRCSTSSTRACRKVSTDARGLVFVCHNRLILDSVAQRLLLFRCDRSARPSCGARIARECAATLL